MSSIDSYTKLLLHCDGADGSTTFIDSSFSGKTITANGNAQVDTAQYKFGGASALFNGDEDYLSVPDSDDWYFGSGNFTIDFWIRFNTFPVERKRAVPYIQYKDDSNIHQIVFGVNSGVKQLLWQVLGSGLSINSSWFNVTINTNTWYHFAFVRNGNNFYVFQNGTQIKTFSDTDAIPNIAAAVLIGSRSDRTGYGLNGWIDEYRISKGTARWTSNFTPPTRAYGLRSQAAFLLNMI